MATILFDATVDSSTLETRGNDRAETASDEARILYKAARAAIKQEIKTDTVEIRQAKAALRLIQKAGGGAIEMSRLHQQRQTARARLALYAFLRGRTWAQFEPIHAEECTISLRIFTLWKKLVAEYEGLEVPSALRAVCPTKWFEVKS